MVFVAFAVSKGSTGRSTYLVYIHWKRVSTDSIGPRGRALGHNSVNSGVSLCKRVQDAVRCLPVLPKPRNSWCSVLSRVGRCKNPDWHNVKFHFATKTIY